MQHDIEHEATCGRVDAAHGIDARDIAERGTQRDPHRRVRAKPGCQIGLRRQLRGHPQQTAGRSRYIDDADPQRLQAAIVVRAAERVSRIFGNGGVGHRIWPATARMRISYIIVN
ncbi:hypothetical protein D3C73_1275000 [compost metagenome]